MIRFLKTFAFILIMSSILFSQESSRLQKLEKLRELNTKVVNSGLEDTKAETKRDKLLDKIISVDEIDVVKAGKLGVEYMRLFPDGKLDIEGIERKSFSTYRFVGEFDYYFSPEMIYRNGNLELITDKDSETKSYGLITSIGGTLLETIDSQNKAVLAINKYEAPAQISDFTGKFNSDGATFSTKANVTVGSTYIVRVFQHQLKDKIYALKIHKEDEDGSIVIFTKLIKVSEPKLISTSDLGLDQTPNNKEFSEFSDADLYTKVQNILNQKGFFRVQIEVKDGVVTLRGSVPEDKFAEAILSVMAAKPKKIVNELTKAN